MTYTKKELKNYLKGLLKEKEGFDTFSFEYLSGHTEFFLRLRLIVLSGKVVHWRIPRGTQVGITEEKKAAKIRETDFSSEQMLVFIDALFKNKIWDLENCTEKPLPDTALLTFVIKEDEKPIFKQEVWESCRNDNDQTKAILKALTATIPEEWTPP